MCWAFDVLPSALHDLYWRVTLEDIRFKLGNRLALQNLTGLQTFQAVAEVVSLAFGGKKGDSAPSRSDFDESAVPKTGAEAVAMFRKVMSGG